MILRQLMSQGIILKKYFSWEKNMAHLQDGFWYLDGPLLLPRSKCIHVNLISKRCGFSGVWV